jgi:hypothetical protein
VAAVSVSARWQSNARLRSRKPRPKDRGSTTLDGSGAAIGASRFGVRASGVAGLHRCGLRSSCLHRCSLRSDCLRRCGLRCSFLRCYGLRSSFLRRHRLRSDCLGRGRLRSSFLRRYGLRWCDNFIARAHGKDLSQIAGRSRRLCGIIRNGRRNWSGKSRNRHAFNNIFGEGCPVATALVRTAEARHIADQRIVTGGKRACRALMISQLSSTCKIDRSFGAVARRAASAPQ